MLGFPSSFGGPQTGGRKLRADVGYTVRHRSSALGLRQPATIVEDANLWPVIRDHPVGNLVDRNHEAAVRCGCVLDAYVDECEKRGQFVRRFAASGLEKLH